MVKNWQIISLGGSLVYPGKINISFLKKFRALIFRWVKKGKKFIIFVGGGKIAREYQKGARKIGIKNNYILDEIGISLTKANASLVKSLFGKYAFSEVLSDPTKKIRTKKRIVIFGGYKPGWSTDYDAVLMAKTLKEKLVINLTNVDFVYDKDPKKFSKAKPLRKISFFELKKIVGKKWVSGGNFPFDPLAVDLAMKERIKIVIMNGNRVDNLNNFFTGRDFLGTEVYP